MPYFVPKQTRQLNQKLMIATLYVGTWVKLHSVNHSGVESGTYFARTALHMGVMLDAPMWTMSIVVGAFALKFPNMYNYTQNCVAMHSSLVWWHRWLGIRFHWCSFSLFRHQSAVFWSLYTEKVQQVSSLFTITPSAWRPQVQRSLPIYTKPLKSTSPSMHWDCH